MASSEDEDPQEQIKGSSLCGWCGDGHCKQCPKKIWLTQQKVWWTCRCKSKLHKEKAT